MARQRIRSLDQLVVNVATINISDEAAHDDDIFSGDSDDAFDDELCSISSQEISASPPEERGAYKFEIDKKVRQEKHPVKDAKPLQVKSSKDSEIEREQVDAAVSHKGIAPRRVTGDLAPNSLQKSPLARKDSVQRRIQQIRIRGKTVWEVQLTDPGPGADPHRRLGIGLFVASDASRHHIVYKVDLLVSSAQLQLSLQACCDRARDRLLEVNGISVSGWSHAAVSALFLSIPLAPARQHQTRTSPRRASSSQPFSMLVERMPRPGSQNEPRTSVQRLLRARLSYHAINRKVVFSEVQTRLVGEVALELRRRRRARLRHPASGTWAAVTSLLDGRSRLCLRDAEGDGSRFLVHEYCTVDTQVVTVYLLQAPTGHFISCCGNPTPTFTGPTGGGTVEEEVRLCDSRCLFSRPVGVEGVVTLETVKAGHLAEYLCVEGRTLQFGTSAPPEQTQFVITDVADD